MRLQEAVAQLVFDKALALTPAAKSGFGVGAIVSFLQIDAKKVSAAAPLLHFLWRQRRPQDVPRANRPQHV